MSNKVITTFFILFIGVIVIMSGCVSESEVNEQSTESASSTSVSGHEEHNIKNIEESTKNEISSISDLENLYKNTHLGFISNDYIKGLYLWVDNAQWKSDSEDLLYDVYDRVWFYKNGYLYMYDRAGDVLYSYAEEDEKNPYPWFVFRIPYNNVVDFATGGESIAILDSNRNLHLVQYDSDNIMMWPNEKDEEDKSLLNKKIIYFGKIKNDISWNVGGNNLATGTDYDDNYAYYVTWDKYKVWIIGLSAHELNELFENNGIKPEPKTFTFDSEIKNVVVGGHAIYVLTENKLYIFDITQGFENIKETSTTEIPTNARLYVDPGYDKDTLSIYNGKNGKILFIKNGKIDETGDLKLKGYDFVGYDSKEFKLLAFKDNKIDVYDVYDIDSMTTEYEGSLTLPEKVKIGYAFIDVGTGKVWTYFWGVDGKYYALVGEINENTEPAINVETTSEIDKTSNYVYETNEYEQTNTYNEDKSYEESETQTYESESSEQSFETETNSKNEIEKNPIEYEIKEIINNFDIENTQIEDLWGVRVHLKKTPDYKNIHDWLQTRTYEPCGLPGLYLAYGNCLIGISEVGESLKVLGENKEPINKYDVISNIYIFPTTPKDFTIGFYSSYNIFMAGKDGNLYLLPYDYGKSSELELNDESIYYTEYPKYITWNIDADGVNWISSYSGDKYYLVAWKGDELYIFTYPAELLRAENNEIPKVEPSVISLPEKITAVYRLPYGRMLIRTDSGLYLYDTDGYYDYGPGKLYTLLKNFLGKTVIEEYNGVDYNGNLVIYNDDKFYWIEIFSKYDENDKNVPIALVYKSDKTFPNVVAFSPMYNTYDEQLIIGYDGKVDIYNVSRVTLYDENGNEKLYLNLTYDMTFNIPFTPEFVYGEDECYCHVHKYEQYIYAWAGNDFYILFGPKHGWF
ncbi:conserved exported protein of unknown function [Methanocaldococcus lauensis]|nr:conserved exported protein of unknown function [Methanocaldococcus lauensis]